MKNKSSSREKNIFLSDPLPLLLSSILALLPLVMLPFGADVYALPKTTFLYISTLALVFLYFIRAIRAEKFVYYRSVLDLPVLLLLIYAAASLFLSGEPLLGLVGKYERYEGLPSLICYVAIYFISVQLIRDDKRLGRMFKIMSLGLIPVVLYGLAQSAGLDFPNIIRFQSGIQSSLANPALLSAYLVIMLPILFSLARNSREENWRLLVWVLLPTGAISLLLAGFREAWLGPIASLLVFLAIWWRSRTVRAKNRRRPSTAKAKGRWVIIGAIALVLVVISLALFSPSSHFEQQLASTFTLSDAGRLETWKASLNMISDRPILGFGLEQMAYWFPAYKTSRHAKIDPDTVDDHARNDFLQVAVDIGVPGLLLYAWVLTIALLSLFKRRSVSSYSSGLLAAIIGYFTQAQVGIPAVFISPIIWSLLGASAGIAGTGRGVKVRFPRLFKSQAIIYIIGVTFVGLSLLALKPIISDIHVYKGKRIANVSPERASSEFETAIRLYPYQTAYARAASEFYLKYAASSQNNIFAQRAALIAEQALNYNKRDLELAYMVGQASLSSYKLTENDMSLSRAQHYFDRVEELWPSELLVKSRLLEIALIRGDMKQAAVRAEELVKMGAQDPQAYYVLATEAQKKGAHEKAERYFRKLEELQLRSLPKAQER